MSSTVITAMTYEYHDYIYTLIKDSGPRTYNGPGRSGTIESAMLQQIVPLVKMIQFLCEWMELP